MFPIAPTLGWIVAARFADRVGKGIRGAPRDALIADLTPAELRGGSFGLRQALDTVGAIGGPLLAIGAMAYFAGDFKAAFWVAVVPAVVCVLLLVFGVEEPKTQAAHRRQPREANEPRAMCAASAAATRSSSASRRCSRWRASRKPSSSCARRTSACRRPWHRLGDGGDVGGVRGGLAIPAGAAADRGLGSRMLSAGLAALIVSDLVLANAGAPAMVYAGAALWGLHMGLTQGLLAALVAAAAPADLRGTAFGVFNLVCGVALLVASALAGWLWDTFGPGVTFYAGAAFTLVAWIGLTRFGRGAGELRRA